MKVIKPTQITAPALISSSATESVALWNAATGYLVGDRARRSTTNSIYQRLVAGTSATAPESDATNWLYVSPSNVWAMFDSKISSKTTAAGSLVVTVAPGYCNSIAFFGLVGDSINVTIRNGLAGPIIYNTTTSLDGTIITNYYEYFFEPRVQKDNAIFLNLPPYSAAHITITITGASAQCGLMAVGTSYDLGASNFGSSTGIFDYSKKDTDPFGETIFVQRAYSDRLNIPVSVGNKFLLKVKSVLTSVRSVPCVWVGVDDAGYEVLNAFGFYKDLSIAIQYPTHSLCNLQIEGLT